MNKSMLQIDISDFNDDNDGEDLMEIQLKSNDVVHFNFSKFFYRSKYVLDKYSEILKSIQTEIIEIKNKYEIKDEIIKEFIELIQKDKFNIQIEHYKDIYTLSKHFGIQKLTKLLDSIMEKLFVKDLDFSIQILLDCEKTNKEEEIIIVKQIENFLQTRINESMRNKKFKELSIPTIYRIIEKTITNNRETIDANILLDFILESAMDRFILFKFVEFHRLNNEKIEEFIKFIDEQEESTKRIYFEYIPFDFIFFKEMKHKYDELLTENQQNQTELKQTKEKYNQSQEELKQTKEKYNQNQEELKQTKEKYNQSQEELKQMIYKFNKSQEEFSQTEKKLKQTKEESEKTKEELNQTKEKSKQIKEKLKWTEVELKQMNEELKQTKQKLNLLSNEHNPMRNIKQYAHTVMVGGYDNYNQLGEKPNKIYGNYHVIHPPKKSSFDPSSLLSFSINCRHSVQITKSGLLLGIGYNNNGRICNSLPKTEIAQLTEFSMRDDNNRQFDPVSAVCLGWGTLYMFKSGNEKHLVLCDEEINGGQPVFLDIGNEQPVSIFGGRSHSGAITNKGEIIFINRYIVINSPESRISSISLPDGEKAISIACCEDSIIALSSNGRIFTSDIESGNNILKFSSVPELIDLEIVSVSGMHDHFLIVSSEGRVFGRGSNKQGQLGLGQKMDEISSFKEILSLSSHRIRAAYAGDWFSLFETYDGKILACGQNHYGELLLSSDSRENVYSPTETVITESVTFCIASCCLSTVFIGGDPPPNTPNQIIQKSSK